MADMIEGNYAFFSNKPAWHKKGIVFKGSPTIETAIKTAYPWEVIKIGAQGTIDGYSIDAPGYAAIARINPDDPSDTPKILGIMSQRYEVTPPAEVFNRFAPMLEAGLVELEAGGSLYEGKRLWVLARVKGAETEIIKGDPIKRYVLFQTSFDGSLQAGAGITDVRVVCANTLRLAQSDVAFKAKHTRNVHSRLDSFADEISRTIAEFRQDAEKLSYLATKQTSRNVQESYIREVIAPESLDPDREVSTKLENKVQSVIELLDTQRGLDLVPAIRGTAWQAYNAITEHVTHHAGRSDDSRLASQWWGEGAALNARALDLALAL